MIWRESLRIGIDNIDEQHKALFDKTEELLGALRNEKADYKQECIAAIHFLKDYSIKHFADEEAYQKSINYEYFDTHQKLHRNFTKNVLLHEKKMIVSDYAAKEVKEFTGMLITWLSHHVADADQTITKAAKNENATYNKVLLSVGKVLESLTSLNRDSIKEITSHNEALDGSIAVQVPFVGDKPGHITYTYPTQFIKNLVYSVMNFVPESIAELEISALLETSNIVSGTICSHFAEDDSLSCNIEPPVLTSRSATDSYKRIILDTGIGIMEVNINIE